MGVVTALICAGCAIGAVCLGVQLYRLERRDAQRGTPLGTGGNVNRQAPAEALGAWAYQMSDGSVRRERNPHNLIVRQGAPPIDMWRCHYCKVLGGYEALMQTECSHVYAPCEFCGASPVCQLDCPGVRAVLRACRGNYAGDA